jgi:3-deoxy-D-manno-octulosonate 8-phosphate phosphatase (KDO 8-P phosphatase)
VGTVAASIRLFVMDVDGTLTDGTLTYTAEGTELKSFHAKDGAGIKLLPTVGITPAIISGRSSRATSRRAAELGIHEVHQGIEDKAASLEALCTRLGISLHESAFVGDDLTDIPPMRLCGFSAAPADAAPEVRQIADFVADLPGGRGAVRQAIEALLRREGTWDGIVAALGRAPAREPGA